MAPRPSALPAPTCATGVLCSCVRGQAGNKNAGARGHADSAGTRKHGLVFLPRAWPSAVSPWVATRCGGGGRMKGARMRNRRLEIVGPADNASSFRSMIQKPQFCPDPAHEVGMEGNHLGWVCKRCHTPSLAKPKWSAADRGTRHFLILRLNL